MTAPARPGPPVVIGVGNPFRRDDGVGVAVVERLRPLLPLTWGVEVKALDGEPTRIIDGWRDAGLAVVVDAGRRDAAPGTVTRIEVGAATGETEPVLACRGASSTHGAGLAQAIALARALGRLPGRLVVYAVEGGDFGDGPGLSPAVEAALDALVVRVREEVAPRV